MLCVSIAEPTIEKVIARLDNIECAEIRLDAGNFNPDECREMFEKCSAGRTLIATYRAGMISEDDRSNALKESISHGAAYVDLEIENSSEFNSPLIAHAREKGCTVIISYHNYEMTPDNEELCAIVNECRAKGADLAKIATLAQGPSDAARLLSLYDRSRFDFPVLCLGMGEAGKITRIAAPLLGAPFTFAAPVQSKCTAPGQLCYEVMRKFYALMDGETL